MTRAWELAKEKLEDAEALVKESPVRDPQTEYSEVDALGSQVEHSLLQSENLLAEGGGGKSKTAGRKTSGKKSLGPP